MSFSYHLSHSFNGMPFIDCQQHCLSDSYDELMFNQTGKKNKHVRNLFNRYPITVEQREFCQLTAMETPKSLFNVAHWMSFFFDLWRVEGIGYWVLGIGYWVLGCYECTVIASEERVWQSPNTGDQPRCTVIASEERAWQSPNAGDRTLVKQLNFFSKSRQQTHPFFINFFFFLLISFSATLFAQTTSPTISGTVLDQDTWQPITDIAITEIHTQEKGNFSQPAGTFVFTQLAPIKTIVVTAKGYFPKVVEVEGRTTPLTIYLKATHIELHEVVVSAFGNQRKTLTTAAAIGLLDKQQLQQTNNLSLVHALNQISGVRMERRAPGSYRIAIRGSALRAPFGVRNIKAYWNEIPLTEPNGETPINLIDVNTVGKVEVIKGPSSSLYGAGNGGAILLTADQPSYNTNKFEVQSSIGSYGLWKVNTSISVGGKKGGIQAQYNHQQLDGYRDHTTFNREAIYINGQYYPTPKSKLAAFALFTDLDYQLPGGLTEEQYELDPRQARAGSAERNASIDKQTFIVGTSFQYHFNRQLQANIAGYSSATQLQNPFNTNYKTEQQTGIGFRGKLLYRKPIGDFLKTKWTVGGEYQQAQSDAKNFGNMNGQRDTLNFADDIQPLQYIAFAQTEWEFPQNWILTMGASYNRLQYDFERISFDQTLTTNAIRFEPELSPRIALLKNWTRGISVYGSLSYGFSPPTLNEVRTSEGTINENLQAERGINYEVGIKGELLNQRLQWTSSLFSLQLRDAIVTRTAESGTVLFSNAGATSNNGMEFSSTYTIWTHPTQTISLVKIGGSYTYNHFRFKDYIKKETDFSGNRLTGVAPHILVLHADVKTKWGVYAHLNYNFTDEIPLNDGNTVFSNAYHLVQAKVGWERVVAKKWQLGVFAGIDNLLNQKYSLGNDLNPFGGRYFQPAPARNYYGGIKVGYKITE